MKYDFFTWAELRQNLFLHFSSRRRSAMASSLAAVVLATPH
jgi:hypothetical protein